MQMQKSDDLAKHQAVQKNDGIYHSSGEKIYKEEEIDAENHSEEENAVGKLHDERDGLEIDVSTLSKLVTILRAATQLSNLVIGVPSQSVGGLFWKSSKLCEQLTLTAGADIFGLSAWS